MTGLVLRLGLAAALAVGVACSKEKTDGAAGGDDKGGGGKGGAGGGGPKPPAGDPEKGEFTIEEATAGLGGEGKLMARISTDKGEIVCELLPDKAPNTVASFVGLARGLRPFQDPKSGEWKKEPYFDGLAFHRVIPSFMIQGGDVLSRNYGDPYIGTGGPGYELKDEIAGDMKFDRPGLMAMANSGPNSAGSQFFITEVPKKHLNGKYTIFGVCENPEVVQEIARVPRDGNDKPNTPITMRVEIFRR